MWDNQSMITHLATVYCLVSPCNKLANMSKTITFTFTKTATCGHLRTPNLLWLSGHWTTRALTAHVLENQNGRWIWRDAVWSKPPRRVSFHISIRTPMKWLVSLSECDPICPITFGKSRKAAGINHFIPIQASGGPNHKLASSEVFSAVCIHAYNFFTAGSVWVFFTSCATEYLWNERGLQHCIQFFFILYIHSIKKPNSAFRFAPSTTDKAAHVLYFDLIHLAHERKPLACLQADIWRFLPT